LLVTIFVVAVIAGVATYLVAFDEANELQDDILRQTASLFDRHHLPLPKSWAPENDGDDAEERVIVQMLSSDNPSAGDDSNPRFPPNLKDGMHTVTAHGTAYRVFVRTLGTGQTIAVGQQTAFRNESAGDAALRSMIPFLLLVPVLLLVVADLVRKMFSPVLASAKEVDQRREEDLQPVDQGKLPLEIRPFVTAINRLLQRVAESMVMQQRFIAAAAHELRSPLTALSLQAERLASSDLPAAAQQRLDTLRRGIERNRDLLDQLLTFARIQAGQSRATTDTAPEVSVQAVFRAVFEDLMPLVEEKRLDVGVDTEADVRIRCSEIDLTTVVKNLVSNAIHYTPVGGRIDVSLDESDDHVVIAVEDNGPGLSDLEKERAFEPFYRALGTDVSGSGLGLSIVKSIVERLRGQVDLEDARRGASGLRVNVRLPRGVRPTAQ